VRQAASAAAEAERSRSLAARRLAGGVRDTLQRLAANAALTADADRGGPYRGLLACRLRDAELFFGRAQATPELLERLQRGRLTVLHAQSGGGKRSRTRSWRDA